MKQHMTYEERAKIFRERFRKVRERDSTWWETADKVCTTPDAAKNWGNKHMPSTATIIKIAEVYDVSIDWLMGLTDARRMP